MSDPVSFGDYKRKLQAANSGPPLSGGGGGGTFDPMEARVKALEERFQKVDGKLDKLLEGFSDFRRTTEVKLAAIEADLKSKATAADVAEVKGRLTNLPTTLQLLGFVIAIFVAAGVAKYFAP